MKISRKVLVTLSVLLTLLRVIAASVVFLIFVWPTAYRYDGIDWGQGKSFPLRINTFTGQAEQLIPFQGWRPLHRAEEPKPEELKTLAGLDRGGIDISGLRFDNFTKSIRGDLYTPTSYTIRAVTFKVEVYSKQV